MNTFTTGLSRPRFLSPPPWTALAFVAAALAAGAAVRFALPTEPTTPGAAIGAAAPARALAAEQPATGIPVAAPGTGVPEAAAVFRVHAPADEPMVPTF